MAEAENRPQSRSQLIHTFGATPGSRHLESSLDLYRQAAQRSGCRFKIVARPGDPFPPEFLKESERVGRKNLGPYAYIISITSVPGTAEGKRGSMTKFWEDHQDIVSKNPLHAGD